jgi:hypothetical protein
MVLQMTSIPEGIFISQYSLANWFSYFARLSQTSLHYITLNSLKRQPTARPTLFFYSNAALREY